MKKVFHPIINQFAYRTFLAGFITLWFLTISVQGANLNVTSAADSGGSCPGPSCTLRQAIETAAPGDTIDFAAGITTIDLTSDMLIIDKDLTINGPGRNLVTVERSSAPETPNFRIFSILDGVYATISGLTISNGNPTPNLFGGAIRNAGLLTIKACAISGNVSSNGGAIYNNGGDPGAYLEIHNSIITGNSAPAGIGGGIFDGGGQVYIFNSTIAGNSADNGTGGGIHTVGLVNAINSTISGNTAGNGAGGGITYGGGLSLTNSTISGNSAGDGGGLHSMFNRQAILKNTIIAKNTASSSPDASGGVQSLGYNLIGDTTGTNIFKNVGDQLNVDPLLGPLQDNGGSTLTHALLPGSPAINAGLSNGSVTDQRGFNRPIGMASVDGSDGSDIGAFEVQGPNGNYSSLGNVSTRLLVGTGDNVLIGGFIAAGTQPKKVIVRAIGPSLALPGTLSDPVLELRNSSGDLVSSNDNWRSNQEAEIIATGIPPGNDLESAIVTTLQAENAAYTAIVRAADNSTGIGIVEAYDLDQTADSKLANISTRGLVQTGNDVLIAGTIAVGQLSQKVLVRAIGPSLGLPNGLGDPTLELRDANGAMIQANDNWRSSQETEIMATGIPPSQDSESAIITTLPGEAAAYTAIVRGVNDTTGVALVEIYALN